MNPLKSLLFFILGISSLIISLIAIIIIIVGVLLSFTIIGLIIGIPLIIIGIFILIFSFIIRLNKLRIYRVKPKQNFTICKNCKNNNTITSKFCSKCGKEL